jgi:hypothetical protein
MAIIFVARNAVKLSLASMCERIQSVPLNAYAVVRRYAPPRRIGRPLPPASKKQRDVASIQGIPPPSSNLLLVVNVRDDNFTAFVRQVEGACTNPHIAADWGVIFFARGRIAATETTLLAAMLTPC